LSQFFWLAKSWDIEDQQFDISARIALNNVALGISQYNKVPLPKTGLITRRSSNIYAVNVNSKIDPIVIEDLLYQEMTKLLLLTDFEYAVYDCLNDNLVYGNYCHVTEERQKETQASLPKVEELNYYFVVIFPSRGTYLVSNLWVNVLIAFLTVISTIIFIYLIFHLLKQRKLSVLQKEFINNMTHEFKTPLSSIKLAAAAIKNAGFNDVNSNIEKYINIIDTQNNRLNDQIERVLRIASLENKKSNIIDKEFIDLNNLISQTANSIKEKHSDYEIATNADEKLRLISGDNLHLTNILFTLLYNAIKYSTKEKKIIITSLQEKSHALVKITDYGIGIAKNEQSKIFDKFYRVSTGDKHDVKGFGLGLYYVKTMCEDHGWEINVESELGKGSTFTIKIPN
jgi:two-component system phosphate regulon sensor histidine kinase PhoR